MASSFPEHRAARKTDLRRRMSTNLAAALMAFALIQIFVIAKMGGSLLLHLGIVVAIGGFALAARNLEHRWAALAESGLPEAGLMTRFRKDQIQLWAASLLAPFLWIPVGIVEHALFG